MRRERSLPALFSRWSLLAVCCCCSGCMAVERVEGEQTVFSQSLLVVAVIGLGGLAFAVIGIGAIKEALPYALQTRPAKKKGKKGGPKRKNGIAQIIVGGLMAFLGLALVLYGVPSTLLSRVIVGNDSVTFRNGSLFFLTSTKIIPYDSISSLRVEEIDTRGFKGRRQTKRILHLSHADAYERIEMNPMHIAAVPRIEQKLAEYRSRSAEAASVAIETPAPVQQPPADLAFAPTTPLPDPAREALQAAAPSVAPSTVTAPAASTAGLNAVPRLGRYAPGETVALDRGGDEGPAEILEVYAEGLLRVRLSRQPGASEELVSIRQTLPFGKPLDHEAVPPGEPLKTTTGLVAGDRLLAQHGENWLPVEVVAIESPTRVAVTWVDEPRGRHSLPLVWLCRIPAGGIPTPTTSSVISQSSPGRAVPATTKSVPAVPAGDIAVGTRLEALWGSQWYPVEVLAIKPNGQIRIHYVGYSDTWDADVDKSKLRPPGLCTRSQAVAHSTVRPVG
jgi:hypothetical protein